MIDFMSLNHSCSSFTEGYAVAGSFFGDEGKGKIIDLLIRKLKEEGKKVLNVRNQGGGNAGHTVIDAETKTEYHFHYLPSGGLLSDIILLGAGMLIDPIKMLEEASMLPEEQQKKIMIDERATLSTLFEQNMDGFYENLKSKENKVGTTGSGVGPTVSYRALRSHITFADAKKCNSVYEFINLFIKLFESTNAPIEAFGSITLGYICEVYEAVKKLNIVDSLPILHECRNDNWTIVLEVSQAFGLDCLFGNSGHYVTSTHTTIPGAMADGGLVASDIDTYYLIAKAYSSKVGGGPYITMFEAGNKQEQEIASYIYEKNGECGVTTGRKRNLGWFDAVATRTAVMRNGSDKVKLVVNCMDTLGKIPGNTAKICVAYKNKKNGKLTSIWPYEQEEYLPVYIKVSTEWDIKNKKTEEALTDSVYTYLACIELFSGAIVEYIGTGGSNEDLIHINDRKRIEESKKDILSKGNYIARQIVDIFGSDYIS